MTTVGHRNSEQMKIKAGLRYCREKRQIMAINLFQLVFDKMLVVTANIHQPLG